MEDKGSERGSIQNKIKTKCKTFKVISICTHTHIIVTLLLKTKMPQIHAACHIMATHGHALLASNMTWFLIPHTEPNMMAHGSDSNLSTNFYLLIFTVILLHPPTYKYMRCMYVLCTYAYISPFDRYECNVIFVWCFFCFLFHFISLIHTRCALVCVCARQNERINNLLLLFIKNKSTCRYNCTHKERTVLKGLRFSL